MQNNKGKSGSYFFFSYDNQIVIKTMNLLEREILIDRLERYYTYIVENKTTFIAKIYGVYTFENIDNS